MHTFETTDVKQARHFRYVQYNGRSATYRLGGMTIKGFVLAVSEHKSAVPARWTITMVPETEAVRTRVHK